MAKRFGRNQKRKMRNEMLALQQQLDIEQNGRIRAALRAQGAEKLLCDIRETVGQHCILFPAKVIPCNSEDLLNRRFVLPPQRSVRMAEWVSLADEGRHEQFNPVVMDSLIVNIEQNAEYWRHNVHVYMQSGKEWVYSISAQTILALPKYARREFALRIAHEIVEYIGKADAGRG